MKRFALCLSLFILAMWNVSFRWPINNPRLTSTFGESRGDHFHDGIDLVSADPRIFPVKDGKLLYAWNKSLFPLENYWGGGNYKIIKHDDNIVSVYMHLQDGENLEKKYTQDDTIGNMGNTGRSYGSHIHFTILNQNLRESLNPFKLMPAYIDEKKPEVKFFYLKVNDRYVRINENSNLRLTRHFPMLIEINDSASGNERLGIYRLKVNFNGKDVMDSEFDKIKLSENGFSVSKIQFNDLYDSAGYYKVPKIQYKEGLNKFIITASDYSGNITEKTFQVNVTLDMN